MAAAPGLAAGGTAPLAVRLAALLARPATAFEAASKAMAPLTPAEMVRASSHPAFARPLGRAVRRSLQVPAESIDSDLLARLDERPASRLAALVLMEPEAAVNAAGARLAAAIVHPRVVRATLRSERERMRAVLGAEGFDLATREAPMLYAPLAGLDEPRVTGESLSDAMPVQAAASRLGQFGVAVLTRFATLTEPAYAGLLPLRWPAACATQAPVSDPVQGVHIVKLIRRMPQWSALIG